MIKGIRMLVLEEIFKSKKAENLDHFNLRVHRSISWFKKSIQQDAELDLKFMSLWIAFNAIYAQDFVSSQDKQNFRQFIIQIYQMDTEHKIYNLIWEKYNQQIRLLLENPYMMQPFWDFQNQKISQSTWKEDFETERKKVHRALEGKETVDILFVILNRLYTLRNQIIHGGSTFNSSVNRKQLNDACNILSRLVSVFIQLFLENAKNLDQRKPFYPVVQAS